MKTLEGERIILKASIKDGKACEKILKIEVDPATIQKEYEEFYRSVAPKAKIPGFRPGKAPREVIAMHFRHEARENVLKNLISSSYSQALRDKSIEPVGMPEIHEVNFDEKKLSYEAHVEIRPKIKLSKVTGLSAKKEKAEIKPEEINEALKRVQESFAQYKSVEDRPAQMGDYVIADYVCVVDGKEAENRKGEWFEIQENEFLKGFSVQLIGAKPGDEREVSITFPQETGRKEIAGKPAVFKVKVNEIKNKTLPALDDELAKEAGEFKSLAELRERIEKDIRENKEHELDAKYERALLDELVKHNKMDLPEGLVKRRLARMVEDTIANTRERGVPESKLEEIKGQIEKDMAPEARRQVHIAFLLDEIAAKENIQIADEDFKKRYERVASQYRQSADMVEKYYQENEEARESLKEQIRSEKAIEFIKSNAKQD